MSSTQRCLLGATDRTSGIKATVLRPCDHSHMAALRQNLSSMRPHWFYLTLWHKTWLSNLPVGRSQSPVTLIRSNWVRAAVVIMSDAVRCWGDPFQLCLETQSARARERENVRERKKSSGFYFLFFLNKIGRLFFTLIRVSILCASWCYGNCGGKTNKEHQAACSHYRYRCLPVSVHVVHL